MKITEPVHNLKRRFESCKFAFWSTHNQCYGWLGSGCFDKNGIEIFEGDIVKVSFVNGEKPITSEVVFRNGTFRVKGTPLDEIAEIDIEVIGHIADAEDKT